MSEKVDKWMVWLCENVGIISKTEREREECGRVVAVELLLVHNDRAMQWHL